MKKTKLPGAVTLAILTLITVIFWVFFSVFRVLTTKSSPKIPGEILEPISPNLKSEIVKQMETRIYFEKNQNLP